MPRFSGAQVAYDFYNDFMTRFTRRLPIRCLLLVTANCNARCRMCNIWRNKTSDLPKEFYSSLFLDECLRNIRHLRLSGGEPTLRDDIYDIGCYAIDSLKNLYRIAIATNGLLPEPLEDTVRRWCEYSMERNGPIVQVQVSLDGVPEIHDKIRGRDSFAGAVDSLRRVGALKATGKYDNLDYHCMTVIQPANVDNLVEIHDLMKSSGWETIYSIATSNEGYYNNTEARIGLTDSQASKATSFLLDRARETRNPILAFYYRDLTRMVSGSARRRGCPMLRETLVIDHRGHVIPCLMGAERSCGAVSRDNPVCSIWNDEQWREPVERMLCPTCTQSCGLSIVDSLRDMAKWW
jgi:MoaA/NifB/PqqE/SkfB family radical SAM enzyme